MKPSVVVETTSPPNFWILCQHSPITLLINAVVKETRIGLDNTVAPTLKFFFVCLCFCQGIESLFIRYTSNSLTTLP